MAIFAELYDGTRLEFPDGTNPSVIQATAKRLTEERNPPKPVPAAPVAPPSKERTYGEALVTDPLASLISGGAQVLQVPG
jgi:hypothetical protein